MLDALAQFDGGAVATPYAQRTIGDQVIKVFESGAQIVIDGATYAVEAISEAYQNAHQAAGEFLTANTGVTGQEMFSIVSQDAWNAGMIETFSELGTLIGGGKAISPEKMPVRFLENVAKATVIDRLSQDEPAANDNLRARIQPKINLLIA